MNLKQLSEHLQLSQTTVSRALNGYPEVNEETRKRVQKAAAELNYAPNPRAKGLATGRSMAIGHVIPISIKHEMVNPVFGDFIAGAGETYAKAGFDLVMSVVSDQDEEKVYREIARKRSVDGMIVHGPKMDDPRIPLLQELGIPFVVHGRASLAASPYAWVDVNNQRAFDGATSHLVKLGHTRIALLNGPESMDFAFRRRNGYIAALGRDGIEPDPRMMFSGEMTEQFGFETAQCLMSGDAAPTGYVVSSMIVAIGVRRALEARRLRMGRDVSIVTYDDDLSYLRNGDTDPIFTATRSSVRAAGVLSGQMLLDMIAKQPADPPTLLLETELVIGGSSGPAPTS